MSNYVFTSSITTSWTNIIHLQWDGISCLFVCLCRGVPSFHASRPPCCHGLDAFRLHVVLSIHCLHLRPWKLHWCGSKGGPEKKGYYILEESIKNPASIYVLPYRVHLNDKYFTSQTLTFHSPVTQESYNLPFQHILGGGFNPVEKY